MSITPAELAAAIRAQPAGLAIDYKVDLLRQAHTDSWPHALDANSISLTINSTTHSKHGRTR